MSKTTWKPGTMVYPVPAVMVTCGSNVESFNIITIAWAGTINTAPAMTYISVRKERHSYDLIKDSGEFVINLTTEALVHATDFCGVRSGRDMNKFEVTGLTPAEATHVKAPLIKEAPVNIECRVTEIKELGSHDMFLAEVLAVHVDDKYIDETGKFNLDQSKPICYSHGAYFGLGDQLGTFGYSVMKKKTKESKAKNAGNSKTKNPKTRAKTKSVKTQGSPAKGSHTKGSTANRTENAKAKRKKVGKKNPNKGKPRAK